MEDDGVGLVFIPPTDADIVNLGRSGPSTLGYKVVACSEARSQLRRDTAFAPTNRITSCIPHRRATSLTCETTIPTIGGSSSSRCSPQFSEVTTTRWTDFAKFSRKMMTPRSALCLVIVLAAVVSLSSALPVADKERFLNELDLVDDDGSIETALINYLFTKQVVKRLRNQMDIGDLQRKRSYWKQCAFNAVSCFGK